MWTLQVPVHHAVQGKALFIASIEQLILHVHGTMKYERSEHAAYVWCKMGLFRFCVRIWRLFRCNQTSSMWNEQPSIIKTMYGHISSFMVYIEKIWKILKRPYMEPKKQYVRVTLLWMDTNLKQILEKKNVARAIVLCTRKDLLFILSIHILLIKAVYVNYYRRNIHVFFPEAFAILGSK